MFFATIKFLFFLLFFLYIPAKILFKLLKLKIEDKLLEFGLAGIFGIAFVALFSLFIRSIGLSFLFLWLIFSLSMVYLISNLRIKKLKDVLNRLILKKNNPAYLILLTVLAACVILQNLVLFRGGSQVPAGLIFPSLHDTMWNIAISAELFHHFPPENPAMSGVVLKNNHYFYPFFLSVIRSITDLDIFDLYFRFGPILISLLFGIGLYAVSGIFTKSIYFRTVSVFLGYFSGNFAYFLPLLFGKSFDWKGNTFFSDQPFDQLINPYSVLGFTLMLFGIFCLSQLVKSKRFSWGYSVVGGLLFGSLYGFKSFGGVTVILALVSTVFLILVFDRKLIFAQVTTISFILFFIIFLYTTDIKKASLVWAPGWLLSQLMTDRDKLNLPYFADLERYYQSTANFLGFMKIKLIELTVYLFGNLGTRLGGLIYLFAILIRNFVKKNGNQKYILTFITLTVLISFSIPLLFNLRNSTFNIIQFTPYGLVLLAIVSGVFAERIYYFFSSHGKKELGIMLIATYLILSIPVNVKNARDKLNAPEDMVRNGELAALKFLRENTKADDIILINPQSFSNIEINSKKISYDPIYVPAISERRVYLASPGYAIQTGLDPNDRLTEIKYFFSFFNKEFLQKNNIAYIYHLKTNSLDNLSAPLTQLGETRFFENDRVIIWKVKT